MYNYSGVDRDGITSFAASEDLERVVKVIDIALEYANDNYEADVLLGTRRLGNAEHKATEAAQRQADLDERAAKLAKPDDPSATADQGAGMKKDQADEFEQELLQPLAKALRTTLGDAGQVHVNNEPHLMTGNRVEYETWLEVVLNDARTEVIFRPLSREDFSAVWQWGKSGRFIFPIPQEGGGSGDSARASVDAVAERIRETASMWDEEPPEWFGWSVT